MLRNEVGWFDKDENNADTLSMRLANDATFVRAAFSNRLSIFIQDTAAVSVALLIGLLLEWRVALVALATLPVLVISAIAQVLSLLYHPKKCCVNRNFDACPWSCCIVHTICSARCCIRKGLLIDR
jgi:hypothetical protein